MKNEEVWEEEEEEEEEDIFECEKCGWKGDSFDCKTSTEEVRTVGGDALIITISYCPECGGEVGRDEDEKDLGVGPTYGDYDPDHAGWDPGDYGDYGEGGE